MYQNKIVALLTDVIPNSCDKCIASEYQCRLPFKTNAEEIKKVYLKKRHDNCPLKLKLEGLCTVGLYLP